MLYIVHDYRVIMRRTFLTTVNPEQPSNDIRSIYILGGGAPPNGSVFG